MCGCLRKQAHSASATNTRIVGRAHLDHAVHTEMIHPKQNPLLNIEVGLLVVTRACMDLDLPYLHSQFAWFIGRRQLSQRNTGSCADRVLLQAVNSALLNLLSMIDVPFV